MQQFTDKAKVALQKAAKAAKDLHQSYIGSEHILVGLVKEKTGVAARLQLLFAKSTCILRFRSSRACILSMSIAITAPFRLSTFTKPSCFSESAYRERCG